MRGGDVLKEARGMDDPLDRFGPEELAEAMAERGGAFQGVCASALGDCLDRFEEVAEVSDPDRPAPFASTLTVRSPVEDVFVASSSRTDTLLVERGEDIVATIKEPVIDAASESGRTGPLHVKPKVYEAMVQELRSIFGAAD